MSKLISLENVYLSFSAEPVLDHIKLQIEEKERICLIGRNGAGKSSLLKIIEGNQLPDSGVVWRKPNLRLARLPQELPQEIGYTVYEYVSQGLSKAGKLLADYHALTHRLAHAATANDMAALERLQQAIDACNGWQFEQQIATVLTRLELNPDKLLSELSGGWQRRAALAKTLVASPELLLLDEPTNHLDIEAIQWLEEQLLAFSTGLLFITHDRSLLQRLATRIIELDRGQLTSWPGDYENFLRRKEEALNAESKFNNEFDKKLAQEERWIRQGIKARRTRNEGRVRALKSMRNERAKRREIQGKANFSLNENEQSGKVVIEAKNISHGFDGKLLINNFSTRILRGDCIGLIGPNGIGKSTLLNILLGKLMPQHGTVTQGTKLQIAYFDQLRGTLLPEKTVIENLSYGSDEIEINGKKRHVISYLSDFLFTPDRAMTPVKALSGGECNRLLLARLFIQPANLLILDEPTNDLDIETLELLEELLSSYQGTLLLVSHDRAFLDNVVTSTIVFEGNGQINEYIGGYEDWLRQAKNTLPAKPVISKEKTFKEKSTSKNTLSYAEQKETDELPKKIEKLETEQRQLHERLSKDDFYQQGTDTVSEITKKAGIVERELQTAYQRWEELEKRR